MNGNFIGRMYNFIKLTLFTNPNWCQPLLSLFLVLLPFGIWLFGVVSYYLAFQPIFFLLSLTVDLVYVTFPPYDPFSDHTLSLPRASFNCQYVPHSWCIGNSFTGTFFQQLIDIWLDWVFGRTQPLPTSTVTPDSVNLTPGEEPATPTKLEKDLPLRATWEEDLHRLVKPRPTEHISNNNNSAPIPQGEGAVYKTTRSGLVTSETLVNYHAAIKLDFAHVCRLDDWHDNTDLYARLKFMIIDKTSTKSDLNHLNQFDFYKKGIPASEVDTFRFIYRTTNVNPAYIRGPYR